MDISLHFGLSGLLELQQSWQTLESKINRPNHSHSFAWWQAYLEELASQPDEFCFISVRQDGETIAICPFVTQVHRRFGLFSARVLASVHDPNFLFPDIMVVPQHQRPDFLPELAKRLSRLLKWDMLVIGGVMGVLETSHAVACLPKLSQPRLFRENEIGCFDVPMDDYEAYQQRLSRKDRANLRRTTKKIEAYDDCLHQSVMEPEKIPQALQTFLDVEAAGWKGAGGEGTAIKVNPEMTRFYEKLAAAYAASGQCQVNLLSVEGNTIAGQFAFQLGDTLYMNKIGFNPDYSGLNPGNVLMGKQFERYCADPGIARVNLMSSAHHLKKWAPDLEPSYRYYLCNTTLAGLAITAFFRLKPWLRKAKARLHEMKKKDPAATTGEVS